MATGVNTRDVSEVLAEHVAGTRYEDIPSETVEVTKKSILDTLGVSIAASGTAPEVKGLVDLVKDGGGKEESTIWGFGGKVPAWMAGFANGALAHALDYDDVLDEPRVHPSATTIPAAFAIAERIGGVGGKELITAVTLGNDVMCRLARGVIWKGNWFLTPVFGVFAATAASGKLLGLEQDKLVDAFGIAVCQATGTEEIVRGIGSNIRGLYDSFVGKAGVLSALLAQRGVSGVKTGLEGKAGLYNVYFKGEYSREAIIDELGKRFEGSKVSFKPWPCCRVAHPSLTAFLELIRAHVVSLDAVRSITVEVNSASQELCTPLEARRRPATPLNAKYSIPYILATALIQGVVTLEDFSLKAINNPQSLALAQKVNPRFNSDLDAYAGTPPARVEIETKDGKMYSRFEEFAYGHPRNPISKKDLLQKFIDCAFHSAKPPTRDDADRVIQMVNQLETVADVGQIVHLLA